jgi:hypothetical protein
MLSIAPSAIEQQTLRVGNSVTITAGDAGDAIVETFDDTTPLAPVRLSSSQSQSFGPYNKDIRFRVSAIADMVTWADISAPSQSGWTPSNQDSPTSIAGSSFEFDQMTALATWQINHGLNRHPSVTVVDSSGAKVDGDVHYNDANSVTVYFSAAFAGAAYLN